jgi:hypothetical protein
LRRLATPPIACVVPPRIVPPVFDAFGWCASDWLDWRTPAARTPWDSTTRTSVHRVFDDTTPIDGSDPHRMVFVFHADAACDFLPRELARLHATGLGLEDEEALAPWGIDAATDELYAHRVTPRDAMWLAADNLNALFWGLHDWAHFHNHGPFEQRAWTELQCDATALAWLWRNREATGVSEARWERLRLEVVALSMERFAAEDVAFDAEVIAAERVKALANQS